MAPDKIYVSIPTRLRSDSPKYVGMAWSDKGNLTTPQIEEYIRKDTLLEWLEERKNIFLTGAEATDDRLDDGVAVAFGAVIDKLNSL